jgi:competence protein ComEC
LAVPLSSLILLTALLLLAMAPFGSIAGLVALVLHWMLSLLNGFIRFMEVLPYSSWKPLQLSLLQCLLLAIALILFTCFLAIGKRFYLFCGFSLVLVFFVLRIFSFHEAAHQQLLLVYQTRGFSLVEKVKGFQSVKLMAPGKTRVLNNLNDPSPAAGILFRYNCRKTMVEDSAVSLVLNVGKEQMVLLQSDFRKRKPHSTTNCRLLLVTGNCKGPPENILSFFKTGLVLIDGSNSSYRLKSWKEACERIHLPFYSTEEQGAFVMPLE